MGIPAFVREWLTAKYLAEPCAKPGEEGTGLVCILLTDFTDFLLERKLPILPTL